MTATNMTSFRNQVSTNVHENQFKNQVKSYLDLVQSYEDIRIQEMARKLIPWKEMTIKAINKMIAIKQNINKTAETECVFDSKDILLIDLLDWFKNEFFEWFDAPNCETCNTKLTSNGSVVPTAEELVWSASRVELYKCGICGSESRFARYNSCEKLLSTRRGRCGEWANCFTLLCRSLNFDARIVLDWTDHVWTEVYSNAQKRWLHCDPCENICDSPLVYELGWNKKLTYCIAISCDEVQDVTWRYSAHHQTLIERRASLCREQWIANFLNELTDNLQTNLNSEKKEQLKIRRLVELVSFIRLPNQTENIKDSEMQGRISGSEAWRLARQEIQHLPKPNASLNYAFEFDSIINNPSIITYNCCSDQYNVNGIIFKQWKTCAYKSENLFREVERDWKMVYLARNKASPNTQIGIICWKLKFKNQLKWSEMKISIQCKTFETGSVNLYIYSTSTSIKVKLIPNKENIILNSRFSEEDNEFFIEASVEGGNQSIGWQQSQLFRQSLDNDSALNTLHIEVRF